MSCGCTPSSSKEIAPPRCVTIADVEAGGRLWGPAVQIPALRDGRGTDREVLERDDRPRGEPDAGERVVGGEHLDDLAVDEPDAAGLEAFAVLVAERRAGVPQDGDVVAELAEHQGLVRAHRAGGQHPDRLVADLPPVAEGAVQHVACPPLRKTRDVRELVAQAGGDQ